MLLVARLDERLAEGITRSDAAARGGSLVRVRVRGRGRVGVGVGVGVRGRVRVGVGLG